MNVAIVHYHLNRGGVTQVILHHLAALNTRVPAAGRLRVCVLSGGRRDGWPSDWSARFSRIDVVMRTIEALDYDNVRPAGGDLGAQIREVLDELGWSPDETILHVHNHALGKNSSLPHALRQLGVAGYRLLLQIHDFAEDFRPEGYRRIVETLCGGRHECVAARLYPQAEHIHYAVLNGRDLQILLDAGVDGDRLHWLPNAVPSPAEIPEKRVVREKLQREAGIPADQRFVLYPVRGIRRKNLGEALLWSALADSDVAFGLTLPPINPVEQPSYRRWKELAVDLGLPWTFELGCIDRLQFQEILAGADTVLTTSVAEGFGLAFLECWLSGVPLGGRDLPEITTDFVRDGMRFPGLRPRLEIPVQWLDFDEFCDEVSRAYNEVLLAYGRPTVPLDQLKQQIADTWIVDDRIDFAMCGVKTQEKIIRQVVKDTGCRSELGALNPWVNQTSKGIATNPGVVESNAEVVRRKYALDACGDRLLALYRHVLASCPSAQLSELEAGERILSRFLSLSRFHALRVQQ